jgi:peptidyl-prolyl cis-trans isomerase A (cyclophilin A)
MKRWVSGIFLTAACAAMAMGQAQAPPARGKSTQPPMKAPAKAAQTKQAFNSALLTPAKLNERAPETFDAKFTTTKGDFVIRVAREWSPNGADRFYNLVKSGYYDGASFFRVVPGFVVQWGLSAHPRVTAAWQAARIADDPVKTSNKKGVVTFAMGGPATRTTQVFINLRDNSRLDKDGFSPFGEIVQGMEIVEQLYSGYGDSVSSGGRGPEQGRIGAEGKAYLDKEFPQLDSIKSTTVVSPAGAPPAPAPAKKAPPKGTAPHK